LSIVWHRHGAQRSRHAAFSLTRLFNAEGEDDEEKRGRKRIAEAGVFDVEPVAREEWSEWRFMQVRRGGNREGCERRMSGRSTVGWVSE
jgi:hypothetical protein